MCAWSDRGEHGRAPGVSAPRPGRAGTGAAAVSRAAPRPGDRRGRLAAAALPLIVACAEDSPALRVVLDTPPAGSPAHPFDGLDELALSVARAGDAAPRAARSAPLDSALVLEQVPFGDDLVVHLSGRAAGVELAYGRSCPTSVTAESAARPLHLFFARIVKWGGSTPLPFALTGPVGAYPLPGVGAVILPVAPYPVLRFAAAQGGFETATVTLAARRGATLSPLPGGRAVLVGGADELGAPVGLVELVDPGAAPGRQRHEVEGPPVRDHAAATLVDGRVLVVGGVGGAVGPLAVTGEAWEIQLGAGDVLDAPHLLPARLASPRARHSATRLGDEPGADVLIVGGCDGAGSPVAETELYRPLRGGFESLPAARLEVPRCDHVATRLPGGFVLVLGGRTRGVTGAEEAVFAIELYDPIQGRFSRAGSLPASAGLTALSVTPLPDGRVLLAGGRDASGTAVATAYIARLDPLDGRVDISPTAPLDEPRAGHAAVALCDGTVLVVGGGSESPATLRYSPPSTGRR
jgi:hypothetical protein